MVSNLQNNLEKEGKAGRNRWKGRKPITKGGCKNPVDHHNGGRNRSRVLASENGRVILGKKTRSKTKYSNKSIFQNRKGIKFNKKTTTKREKK